MIVHSHFSGEQTTGKAKHSHSSGELKALGLWYHDSHNFQKTATYTPEKIATIAGFVPDEIVRFEYLSQTRLPSRAPPVL